ncbi:MAG: imidazolonepropionase, partial [Mesorhizobium sp.]
MAGESKDRAGEVRLWRNARLATMAKSGLGIVEDGAIAARDGLIVYA